jgi:alpha-acetolactate decarboxylase
LLVQRQRFAALIEGLIGGTESPLETLEIGDPGLAVDGRISAVDLA